MQLESLGEPSGDTLGAGLIHALKAVLPDVHLKIAGPKMVAAG